MQLRGVDGGWDRGRLQGSLPANVRGVQAPLQSETPGVHSWRQFLRREDGKPGVFNLGTQPRPGRGASYPVVETVLSALRATADENGITSIAIPRIAAGYGGLSWKKVKALIDAAFADWPGMLYVYEEFKEGE